MQLGFDAGFVAEATDDPRWPNLPGPQGWTGSSTALAYGLGLTGGRLPELLAYAASHHKAPSLAVVRARSSALTFDRDCRALVEAWEKAGHRAQLVEVDGSHGFWNSLPRVAAIAERLEPFIVAAERPA